MELSAGVWCTVGIKNATLSKCDIDPDTQKVWTGVELGFCFHIENAGIQYAKCGFLITIIIILII